MYKKIYYSEFKDINNNTIRIEIYKDTTSSVIAKEVILASDAVSVDYAGSNDLFAPLKVSGCKISILTKSLLTDLYTGKANEVCCKVFRNNSLFWYGYITPNIYNSDYIEEHNRLDVEFVDLIGNLSNYNYTYISGTQALSSFYSIIAHVLDKVDTDRVIKNIYVQNSKSIDGKSDLLNTLYINERNFYDEEEENEKCKDVLEYIAGYLGMTLVQFADSLYFIDYEAFRKDNHSRFIKYSRTSKNATPVVLPTNTININSNVYQANASVSLNDVYNKVVVIGNNNPIDALLPELFDIDDLVNQNTDPNKYYETERRISKIDYVLLTAFFKSKGNWSYLLPRNNSGAIPEVTISNVDSITDGTFWQRCDSYKKEDGEPSSNNWREYLSFICKVAVKTMYIRPLLSLNNNQIMLFKSGYFLLNLRYKYSTENIAHDVINSPQIKYPSNKDTLIPCHLSIANHYYDGEDWVNYNVFNLKKERGYFVDFSKFDRTWITGSVYAWYYYIDSYGYKRYISKSEYDALPSSAEKYTGKNTKNEHAFWFINSRWEEIYVESDYFYECMLLDNFGLVHSNKKGDNGLHEEKSIDNTVSYKMNLLDSKDALAIKLPTFLLYGELNFKLFPSEELGWASIDAFDRRVTAMHVSELSLIYTTDKYKVDLFSGEQHELDTKYENEIDSDNVTEFDDIELRVNTYYQHASSYSYVIQQTPDGYDYVNEFINSNTGSSGIMEEHIINKYHDYYSSPRFIYSNSIRGGNMVTPLTKFYENTLGKYFIGNYLTFKLSTNSVDIVSNEE